MTNTSGSAFGMAELKQGGSLGHAESQVDLVGPGGSVAVDVSAGFSVPTAQPQPGELGGFGLTMFKS
jgi:hypothetical protein